MPVMVASRFRNDWGKKSDEQRRARSADSRRHRQTGRRSDGKHRFDEVCGDRRVSCLPDAAFDPAEVHYAAVWKPGAGRAGGVSEPAGDLQSGRRRRRADGRSGLAERAAGSRGGRRPHRPHDGICRAARADASPAGALFAGQPAREALGAEISMAGECRFSRHHGPGHAGCDAGHGAAASWLSRLGLEPEPEGRSTASNAFTATRRLDAFLQRTDILVCLLPLTPDTRHILNRGLFARLNRNSPIGAPVLINAGRGGLQNEADILGCLDDGTLGAASLDVLRHGTAAVDSPFWSSSECGADAAQRRRYRSRRDFKIRGAPDRTL